MACMRHDSRRADASHAGIDPLSPCAWTAGPCQYVMQRVGAGFTHVFDPLLNPGVNLAMWRHIVAGGPWPPVLGAVGQAALSEVV